MSVLDPNWLYIPADETKVADTFRRFGFVPTTPEERYARQNRKTQEPAPAPTAPPTLKRVK